MFKIDQSLPTPRASLLGTVAYRPKPPVAPTDLRLDGNEGQPPRANLLDLLQEAGPDVIRRYPNPWSFETRLAGRLGVDSRRVLVTAGGDDAIDRVCRAFLWEGRELVLPVPTFEMIARYAALAGGRFIEVPWPTGPYPVDQVLARVGPQTGVIAVVSPNNPTGAVASSSDLERLSSGAPGCLILVDLAYGEFADTDLMATSLRLPNTVAVRSLSKAWGMAGLRVGYAVGPAKIIDYLRAAGGPYAVSLPSLVLAERALETDQDRIAGFVERVRVERNRLETLLAELGVEATPSQANFILARDNDPAWLRDRLAGLGIAVRVFSDSPGLKDRVRITCPGDEVEFDRLVSALKTCCNPQALVFDLDGVLADVSESYRKVIGRTAAAFGVGLSAAEIDSAKAELDSNNDWKVTRRLLLSNGVDVSLAEVRERFEDIYQGTPGHPGLCERERLIPDREVLVRLARRLPLALVTGRPRKDTDRFCERAEIAGLFAAVICMEDGPAKPDPAPVRLALQRLGVRHAWMVGDTPDDIRAARAAGVLALGVLNQKAGAVEQNDPLSKAGAGRVLCDLGQLEELLP
jgi:histidinol-phosphate aminotransferase